VGGAWLLYTHTRVASYVIGFVSVGLLLWTVWLGWRRHFLAAALALLGGGFFGNIAFYVFTNDTVFKLTQGFLLRLDVTPKMIGVAATVAAALGILACVAPAWTVARLSVVKGLKTLD
jgi:hypothetical protein